MSLAGALAARGIGPGDAVAVQLPNVPEWVEIAYGARRLGAMCVAVNTRFGPREVRDIVERSGAKFLVTDLSDPDADAPDPPDRSDRDGSCDLDVFVLDASGKLQPLQSRLVAIKKPPEAVEKARKRASLSQNSVSV